MALEGKRVLVMGLGVHGGGLGVVRFLVEQGAEVTVTDLRSPAQLATTLEELAGLPVRYVLGEHREEDFRQTDIVVRNPAVPPQSPFLRIAREAGAAIEMEMSLFFALCPAPITAITGTKGKTTTTTLTGAIMRECDPRTVLAGNLRVSALKQLGAITETTPVVLELSSFQIEGLVDRQISPHVAVVTNVSPDHLDRYKDMAEYTEAKRNIYLYQRPEDYVVLNRDHPVVSGFAETAKGMVIWFSCRGPLPAGERGVFSDGDTLYWQDSAQAEAPVPLLKISEIRLPGEHNIANVAAAAAAALVSGAGPEHVARAVRAFAGVADRLELIRVIADVRYYNDTTSTTPTSTVAALRSFKEPVVLIMGGSEKNLDFSEVAEEAARRAKAIVLLAGTATPRLAEALQQTGATNIVAQAATLKEAVDAARGAATGGDIVLFSPACASFGLFANEFDRGEQFRRIISVLR